MNGSERFQGPARGSISYATLGFSDRASLDDGAMWPTAFASTALTAAEDERLAALVKKVVAEENPPTLPARRRTVGRQDDGRPGVDTIVRVRTLARP